MSTTRTKGSQAETASGFIRELGFTDATMIVAGSMIGSGIFIVPAEIARNTGAGGWLILAWVATGLLTVTAALAYGELAAMMPHAGGQYVYLRESYSPLYGFLYGWTLFLVIQSGTIAAVAVAFVRYLGVLVPSLSSTSWIVQPINLSASYAVSLSAQQLVAILLIALLTFVNTRGIRLGKLIQNTFTTTKTISLIALIVLAAVVAIGGSAVSANFSDLWTPRGVTAIKPDFAFVSPTSAADGVYGLLIACCVAQVGSLFSADAWNNITFTGAEVKNPQRNIPLAMAAGTGLVITLYVLANVAYLILLPFDKIQGAPDDRVAAAALQGVFGASGAAMMAVAIMISTFGCNNGLVLAGARVYYAMARDGLFFKATGKLNARHVPAVALVLQGIWTSMLILPRTRLRDVGGAYLFDPSTGLPRLGNVYSDLLDYVVFAALLFYILTIGGLFILRIRRPAAPRPYRAFGYPFVPAFYIATATVIALVLILYRTQTTWPGLAIVLTGVPIYFVWARVGRVQE